MGKWRYVAVLLWLNPHLALAQQRPTYSLQGVIQAAETGKPLEGVYVGLTTLNRWAISDAKGRFVIPNVPAAAVELTATLLGYEPEQISVDISTGKQPLVISLRQQTLALAEVRVVAKEQALGSGSMIGRQAIQHVQPVSLADVLQLVPGQLAINPDLSHVQQSLLRQAPTSTAADRMNALGTALILDGVPLSNNANLQSDVTILNASAGSLPPFSSAVGRGNDLRQIPADNIESVEVIRGIPSVRFGDLTTGGVLVTTRAGVYSPRLTQRLNPNLSQTAFGYGFRTANAGTFNIDTDLAFSRSDPRDFLNRFTRWNNQLTWTRNSGEWTHTARIGYNTTLDALRQSPDARNPLQEQRAHERTLRLNLQGGWRPADRALRSLTYTLGYSVGRQNGYYQDLITRDIFPISSALSDTTLVAAYGKSEYLNQTRVDGNPKSLYGRLESNWFRQTGTVTHRPVAGTEWNTTVNKGLGRQFDPLTPPRQNYSMGDRPRAFADMPALHQWALYAEDRLTTRLRGHEWTIQAGVRLDQLSVVQQQRRQWQTQLAPRINSRLEVVPGGFLRAGYGWMYKAPTLSYLYPNPTYYDLVNFNYFATDPAERMVVMTTRRIVPDTRSVRSFKARKWEVGLDWASEKITAQLTYFRENTDRAYQIVRRLQPLTYARLKAVDFPKGQQPVLSPEPVAIDTFMAAYDTPVANLMIQNQGVEFTVEVAEIKPLRTSFYLTGAWIQTVSRSTEPFLDANRAVFRDQTQNRIPIYTPTSTASGRFNTSLRVIHRIPALQLVASALIQTIWSERNRYLQYDSLAIGYYTKAGQRVWLTPEQSLETAHQSLRRGVNPVSLNWQERPPVWLLNLRLTKEWKAASGFAFYVNNVLANKPLYDDNVSRVRRQRDHPSLFFGVEVFYAL